MGVLKRFQLEGTGMSVMLPSKPSKGASTLDSIAGKLSTVEYNTGTGTLLFTVSYTDLPENVLTRTEGDSVRTYYQNALDRILASTKAQVLARKEVQYGNYAGEEIVLKTGSNFGIRTRFLLINNRFIQLTANHDDDNIDNLKIEEFMSSFTPGE